MTPDLGSIVQELAHSVRAAGGSEQITGEVRAELIAFGSDVAPHVIAHLRGLIGYDEDDEPVEYPETEAFISALARIDDERAKQYVIDCGAQLMEFPLEPTYPADVLGHDAFGAMAASDDHRLHEVLADWVVHIDTLNGGYGWSLWWLLDAARPFLDERARPVLVALHDDRDRDYDVTRSAFHALEALDRLSQR